VFPGEEGGKRRVNRQSGGGVLGERYEQGRGGFFRSGERVRKRKGCDNLSWKV